MKNVLILLFMGLFVLCGCSKSSKDLPVAKAPDQSSYDLSTPDKAVKALYSFYMWYDTTTLIANHNRFNESFESRKVFFTTKVGDTLKSRSETNFKENITANKKKSKLTKSKYKANRAL